MATPYDDDQEFDYAVDFVPHVNQHATAIPERWSVEGGGWGPNPRTLNEGNQNFKGVKKKTILNPLLFPLFICIIIERESLAMCRSWPNLVS